MRRTPLLLLLWPIVAAAEPPPARARVEKTTAALVAQGWITGASDAQVDVTAKFTRQPLDKQAAMATKVCQMWAVLVDAEDPDRDPNESADEVAARASCDVTRGRVNLIGRTLGADVRWERWYLRDQGRAVHVALTLNRK